MSMTEIGERPRLAFQQFSGASGIARRVRQVTGLLAFAASHRVMLALALSSLTTVALASDPASAPSLADYIGSLCSAAFRQAPPREAPFLSKTTAAMTKMLVGMEITPSGDVDRDFSAMMIPHHRSAIDMAEAELSYGRNPLLQRIAQEIIVDQQQEIDVMRVALRDADASLHRASDQNRDPNRKLELDVAR